ncbi:MAG: 23S rRNA (guanosine(2251)-2'-O)-methyltransferase RlmB [Acidiferrobacterales bacterium]
MKKDVICGIHAVLTALQRNPKHIDTVWLNEDRLDKRSEEIVRTARAAHVKLWRVPHTKLDKLAGTERHQGVVGRYRARRSADERGLQALLAELTETPLLLILDGVQDPHNLGACLRSADGLGAHAVIMPRDRAVSVTATVRRTASGAAESVPVFEVTNLSRALHQLKNAGIWLLGASQEAETVIFEADLDRPLGLVLGGEEKGLRRLTREHCDALVRIPMLGTVSSLNVSVAAAVCLYEALRQRQVRDS